MPTPDTAVKFKLWPYGYALISLHTIQTTNHPLCFLIPQAERMSVETGCWLFLAAAHPYGGQRMVTFSSAKLRQEGLVELNDIVNDVNGLMHRMRVSRRADAMVLQRQFQQEKAAREIAEAELATLREAMQASQSQTELLLAEVARIEQFRHLIPIEDEGDDFGQGDDDGDIGADPEAPI